MSKNRVSIEQLRVACRHVRELLAAGMTENLSIRSLELFADVYAKIELGGSATPHQVKQIPLSQWSTAALKIWRENPQVKARDHFVVEHGTPRRQFARLVLSLYERNLLTEEAMKSLCRDRWVLAVITTEENARLNRLNRSGLLGAADERWRQAGITFETNISN